MAGTTERTAVSLCGVNRNTAAYYFLRLRVIIAYELEAESEDMFGGEIEVDESCLAESARANVGELRRRKVPVFGLLNRGGKVYAKIIPDASVATLVPIFKRKMIPDSIVYPDC